MHDGEYGPIANTGSILPIIIDRKGLFASRPPSAKDGMMRADRTSAHESEARMSRKIFCIGLAKTGTTSLHQAFEMLGIQSLHHGVGFAPDLSSSALTQHLESAREFRTRIQDNVARGAAPLEGLPDYEAYLDVAPLTKHFRVLDKCYPGAKFIWTERDDRDWVLSRIKHVIRETRRRLLAEAGPGSLDDLDPDLLIERKNRLAGAVKAHFANRPGDLLVINVCAGQGFDLLCPFLGVSHPNAPFPWANRHRYADKS